jgi:demethylspheroidene O-methyltransferase
MGSSDNATGPTGPVGALPASWREKWLNWRNARLSSPAFQRWAARFPVTRPIARRNARALFDIVAGFVYSQVLSACVRCGLFDKLAAGPQPLSHLAHMMDLEESRAETLLKAAASLGLVEALPGRRFALGVLGAALRGNPSLVGMIEHHAMLYADLSDPVALLRRETGPGQLAKFWAYAANPDPSSVLSDRSRAYSALMADSQALVAADILDACDLRPFRKLLDIGGGEGAFLCAVGARFPMIALESFDLPANESRARDRLAAAGLSGRSKVYGGDFFRDSFPVGADIVSLVRVLHDHDDEAAMLILRRIRAVLPKGGALLIAEPMSGVQGAEPAGDAYFGLYLAAMGSGRPRRASEIREMLVAAGFRQSHELRTHTPLLVSALLARV